MKIDFVFSDDTTKSRPCTNMKTGEWGRLYNDDKRIGYVYRGVNQFLYYYADYVQWDELRSSRFNFLPVEKGDQLTLTF